ncbi:MAG: OmpA family protein [Candidatus Omnitrophota bacterium]
MNRKKLFPAGIAFIVVLSMMVSGCAVNFYKQSPRNKKKIKDLQAKINDLEEQRSQEQKKFAETKRMLEQKLRSQIDGDQISLHMDERGLVIILSDDVLFDSGKAEVKPSAKPVLDKVASTIKKKVPGKNIGVSGHTDNVSIKHSKWKSNWELSTARATNVLHYLVKEGVSPDKLSATGYGEHKSIASNSTSEGRAKNRRVEIVILPQYAEKSEEDSNKDIK